MDKKTFPQGLKPSFFSTLDGAAKAAPFQNTLEFKTILKMTVSGQVLKPVL
jgi:hypothetical protein